MNNTHGSPKQNTLIGGKTYCWGSKTYVMGIINLTLDSFSGDGIGYDPEIATKQALTFQEQGADFIDVGG